MAATTDPVPLPPYITSRSTPRDALKTATSELQDETTDECFPFLSIRYSNLPYNRYGLPRLQRSLHTGFLKKHLGPLPSRFLALDPSRPWVFYWCLTALYLLGENVAEFRDDMVATACHIQNSTGGFGGGFGQDSHLATTYATVLALATVGGKETFDVIDRRAMWQWLSSLKQPDGGFQMAYGGEVDVRGTFCAAVIIALLDLPLGICTQSASWADRNTTLLDKIPEYIQKCQTYEGGISGRPGAEAHGAYAFCALGCLSILDAPHRIIPKYLNVSRLIAWLSSRQYAPEGGMSGRTNKLVDGCYSHWVGGCWPLLDACLSGTVTDFSNLPASNVHTHFYSREALIRYILCCCQNTSKRGGLRDKPSKMSDGYHSCYVLWGLSNAQNRWHISAGSSGGDSTADGSATDGEIYPYSKGVLLPRWTAQRVEMEREILEEDEYVKTLHPVFGIPVERVDEIRRYFGAKMGF